MATQRNPPGDIPSQADRYTDFLRELRSRGLEERDEAERAVSAVLCVLEQRLSGGEARKLLRELPSPVQEQLGRCVRHPGDQAEDFARDEFTRRVGQHLGQSEEEAEGTILAVFGAARALISDVEAENVSTQLPQELRELWEAEKIPAISWKETTRRYEAFINELRKRGVSPELAEPAAEAVLCTLQLRLSGGEDHKLLAELPLPLRELLRRCQPHRFAPALSFGPDEFIQRVADHLSLSQEKARSLIRVVFEATRRQLSTREAISVYAALPLGLKELWLGKEGGEQPSP